MRVFCQAQQFAGVNIDENLVCESMSWLIQNQRGDGALPEIHAVIHKEMVVRNATQTLITFTSNSYVEDDVDFCLLSVLELNLHWI